METQRQKCFIKNQAMSLTGNFFLKPHHFFSHIEPMFIGNRDRRTGAVVQRVKPPHAVPASHTSTGSSSNCFISNPAL